MRVAVVVLGWDGDLQGRRSFVRNESGHVNESQLQSPAHLFICSVKSIRMTRCIIRLSAMIEDQLHSTQDGTLQRIT
jgi:hypothetical protein